MYIEKTKQSVRMLKYKQLVICKCPDWCSEGFQIGYWNGREFDYDECPNNMFDETVISFMLLDDDGEPK